ncbi:SDR family oxidoreductase [bacterium]|nr:MAG: SDR family oxidoreductase [bacterium]
MGHFVIITGSSSGIGKSLAKVCAKNKRNLILVARRIDELNLLATELIDTYSVKVICISSDLTVSSEREKLFETIEGLNVTIDICINNAGIGLNGAFVNSDWKKLNQLMALNMEALVHVSKFYLYIAQKQGYGHLVQIASTASFFAGPYMAVYYASKAFVLSFSKGLKAELASTPIHLSVVCPGPTKTEFQHVAGMDTSILFTKTGNAVQTADEVALYAFRKILAKKFLIIPGALNRLSVRFSAFTPTFFSNWIIMKLHH